MSRYRIWKDTSGSTELVKVGWSWPAFLFGGFWALVKRMTLLGIGMLLIGAAISFGLSALSSDDDGTLVFIGSLLLGTIFGANGNTWREKYLNSKGFSPVRTINRSPVWTLRMRLPPRIKALWHDPVWSKVIAGLVLSALGGTAFLLRHGSDRATESADYGVQEFMVPTCHRATIRGSVDPIDGAETLVWSEWGETPDLGRTTPKQRFTKSTRYYQHLVGLTENATYYYRAVASNRYGTEEGRVFSFNTSRC